MPKESISKEDLDKHGVSPNSLGQLAGATGISVRKMMDIAEANGTTLLGLNEAAQKQETTLDVLLVTLDKNKISLNDTVNLLKKGGMSLGMAQRDRPNGLDGPDLVGMLKKTSNIEDFDMEARTLEGAQKQLNRGNRL